MRLLVIVQMNKKAELAELVDALDSGSSVRKDFRVQVPGSAFNSVRAIYGHHRGLSLYYRQGIKILC